MLSDNLMVLPAHVLAQGRYPRNPRPRPVLVGCKVSDNGVLRPVFGYELTKFTKAELIGLAAALGIELPAASKGEIVRLLRVAVQKRRLPVTQTAICTTSIS